MEPRLKTSQQWTPYPSELCEQTVAVLSERFVEEYGLDNAEFIAEGRIYNNEIIGRYGLRFADQLKQYNFEISMDYDGENDKVLTMIQESMDVIEHLFTEFLEDGCDDSELTDRWQLMQYEKRPYSYRYTTVNTKLEQEADQWLSQYEKKLVYDSPAESEETTTENADSETLH